MKPAKEHANRPAASFTILAYLEPPECPFLVIQSDCLEINDSYSKIAFVRERFKLVIICTRKNPQFTIQDIFKKERQ